MYIILITLHLQLRYQTSVVSWIFCFFLPVLVNLAPPPCYFLQDIPVSLLSQVPWSQQDDDIFVPGAALRHGNATSALASALRNLYIAVPLPRWSQPPSCTPSLLYCTHFSEDNESFASPFDCLYPEVFLHASIDHTKKKSWTSERLRSLKRCLKRNETSPEGMSVSVQTMYQQNTACNNSYSSFRQRPLWLIYVRFAVGACGGFTSNRSQLSRN